MPLVMTLSRGEDFFIGDRRAYVSRVHDEQDFDLTLDNPSQTFRVNRFTGEIGVMPGVIVEAPDFPPAQSNAIRVAVNAPGIVVTPGKLYRNSRPITEDENE